MFIQLPKRVRKMHLIKVHVKKTNTFDVDKYMEKNSGNLFKFLCKVFKLEEDSTKMRVSEISSSSEPKCPNIDIDFYSGRGIDGIEQRFEENLSLLEENIPVNRSKITSDFNLSDTAKKKKRKVFGDNNKSLHDALGEFDIEINLIKHGVTLHITIRDPNKPKLREENGQEDKRYSLGRK